MLCVSTNDFPVLSGFHLYGYVWCAKIKSGSFFHLNCPHAAHPVQSVLVVKTTEYASHVLLSNQFSVPSHQSFWSDDVSHLFQQLLTKPVLESFVWSA